MIMFGKKHVFIFFEVFFFMCRPVKSPLKYIATKFNAEKVIKIKIKMINLP